MDSLGDRIKKYESIYQYKLTPKSYLFIRIDGKSFHSFTRGLVRPFSQDLIDAMVISAIETAKEMQGFKLAYVQSDEATFMLMDFDTFQAQGWFDYELSKILSVSSSIFTANFNKIFHKENELAYFDSRAFIVPDSDWPNVFIWRQKDWERNSLQMFARSIFSHKQLNNKNHSQIHEMLHSKGFNWSELSEQIKNGTFISSDYKLSSPKTTYESIQKIAICLMERPK